MNSNHPFIELRFSPNLALVGRVRAFVTEFYEEILPSTDVVSRLALATHELLENAVKYSVDGMSRIRVEYLPESKGGRILVRTWNRPSASDLAALRELIREIQESDPHQEYQRLIERTSHRATGSGLGLGRVRAEGEMSLRFEENEGEVCVIAEAEAR